MTAKKQRRLVLSFLLVLLIGTAETVCTHHLSFLPLYLVPIGIAASIKRRIAVGFALLAAAFQVATFFLDAQAYPHPAIFWWNLSVRFACALYVIFLVSALRQRLDRERELSRELRDALAHVKTLKGMLPICASCKRIRDDEGYWRQIEEYILTHSDAELSHSICPTCVAELYPQVAQKK